MIDEIRSWGVDVPLVVADAGYGDAAAFRRGLEGRKLPHAVGISSRFERMYSRFVVLHLRPAGHGIGRATDEVELPERWLLAKWPAGESEPVQFRLSSLPSGMPPATLVRLVTPRWSTRNSMATAALCCADPIERCAS
ncbi:hypothetical protein QFZ76_009375 [Streptomyces sp. V4I2]|nr:transposase [Streptomyces sp. V4I2]MDQ1051139.1 hypothetical protein [Streptomyces sp. V4I2]